MSPTACDTDVIDRGDMNAFRDTLLRAPDAEHGTAVPPVAPAIVLAAQTALGDPNAADRFAHERKLWGARFLRYVAPDSTSFMAHLTSTTSAHAPVVAADAPAHGGCSKTKTRPTS